VFLLGALVSIPASLINEWSLEFFSFFDLITYSIVAPVVEESLKFSVVFFFVYPKSEFDKPMDGILYAATAGLGFAMAENIGYVFEFGIATGFIRAFTAIPGHVIFSCIWGFALGIAKFRPESTRRGIIMGGLAGAMILHGFYNFIADLEGIGTLLILVAIIPIGWWITMRNISVAHADPASLLSAMKKFSPRGSGNFLGRKTKIVTDPNQPAPFPHLQGNHYGTVSTDQGEEEMQFCTQCGARFYNDSRFCDNCRKEL
jgi:RsiW-degrading membrane proteinase PrsW (M82 family)